MDSEEIKKQFPEASINEDIGKIQEGMERRSYTLLFPDTADEIQITWDAMNWDAMKRTKINDLKFSEEGNWKSSTGKTV